MRVCTVHVCVCVCVCERERESVCVCLGVSVCVCPSVVPDGIIRETKRTHLVSPSVCVSVSLPRVHVNQSIHLYACVWLGQFGSILAGLQNGWMDGRCQLKGTSVILLHHHHDAATVSILATYILQTGQTRLMVACCCTTLAAHAKHTHLWPAAGWCPFLPLSRRRTCPPDWRARPPELT